jgi:uncharacterized membrane protein
VFIDGYITTAEDVKNLQVGCEITVTGLASYDNSFDGVAPRIRIRNRADVVCGDVVVKPVDKTALEAVIDETKALNPEEYTEESIAALTEVLNAALAILADENATQEDVDAAAAALKAAISALEKKPAQSDPTDPETEPTEPEETTKPGSGDNSQTGDEFNPVVWIAIMALALVGVVVLFVLRKKTDK